jgi:hypothetical protein
MHICSIKDARSPEAEHQLDQRAATSICRQTIILWTDYFSLSNGQEQILYQCIVIRFAPRKFSLVPQKTGKERQKVPLLGAKTMKNCLNLKKLNCRLSHPVTQTTDRITKPAWKSQLCRSVHNRNWLFRVPKCSFPMSNCRFATVIMRNGDCYSSEGLPICRAHRCTTIGVPLSRRRQRCRTSKFHR